MLTVTRCVLMACIMFYCDAVTYREQLDHIVQRRRESRGIYPMSARRQFTNNNEMSVILGVPSYPSHLPEAEPILPGHTLIRPSRGMLKSSVKFPHRDLDEGSGVYGNVNNLGIRYDGRNERLQYSGFRRMPDNLIMAIPEIQPQFSLTSFLELSDRSEEHDDFPKRLKVPLSKGINRVIIELDSPKYIQKRNGKQRKIHKKNRGRYQDSLPPASYNEHMFKKIMKNPALKLQKLKNRFRPPHTRPRGPWHKRLKPLADYDSMRRDRKISEESKGTALFIPNGDASDTDYYIDTESEEKKKQVSKETKNKVEWFWKSKDAYNNIKINQDAPELSDLMPATVEDKAREWWFYHQDDFVPFKN